MLTEAEELELLLLEEEELALSAAPDPAEPADESPDEGLSFLESAAGTAQSIGQGLIPFYDEIGSGVRAVADPTLYGEDRSIGERYDVAQEQAKGGLEKFREANPELAFAQEAAAGFISPLNKIGNVGQVGQGLWNTVKAAGRNVGRNAVEGGIYGAGMGEGNDRVESALTTAATAAAFTAALDTGGRTLGGLIDGIKLRNDVTGDVRVPDLPELGRQKPIKGENIPIHISNPRTIRGGIQRQGLGRLPGANEALVEQSVPHIKRARADYSDAETNYRDQGRNLETQQDYRQAEMLRDQQARTEAIEGTARAKARGLDDQARIESDRIDFENSQVADSIDAQARGTSRAIDEREASAGLEQARMADQEAQFDVERQMNERIAVEGARDALNIEVLQNAVPAGRQDAVTEIGTKGYEQALGEVNAAYAEALDGTKLAPDTVANITKQAEDASRGLGEADTRILDRIVRDAKKVSEGGGYLKVLDERLRDAIKGTQDTILKTDLEDIRVTLRDGLPTENKDLLKEVDRVYPNLLVAEKAYYASGGRPASAEQLETASKVVAGPRRTARGEAPLIDRIQRDVDLSPKPIPEPSVTAPGLEQSRALQLERQAAADTARDAKRGRAATSADAGRQVQRRVADEKTALGEQASLEKAAELQDASQKGLVRSRIEQAETRLLGDKKKDALAPLKEARDTLVKDATLPNESLYMAALLSNLIPGPGAMVPKAGSTIGIGRKLASPAGQKFVAGQGEWTRLLAEYIRSGKSEYLTRAAALAAGKEAQKENN